MYNYSIAMKLPFVQASPLLPLFLLPTIVGSPVPLTLPNTLKDLLEQRGVASPVCKCTKKVCTYLPVFSNLHDPPHILFCFFLLFFALYKPPTPWALCCTRTRLQSIFILQTITALPNVVAPRPSCTSRYSRERHIALLQCRAVRDIAPLLSYYH